MCNYKISGVLSKVTNEVIILPTGTGTAILFCASFIFFIIIALFMMYVKTCMTVKHPSA